DMMIAADYMIDMGPKAGRLGGEVVFEGTPQAMLQTDTLTSQYFNGKKEIEIPAKRRSGNAKSIWIRGARGNNLKNRLRTTSRSILLKEHVPVAEDWELSLR
ncbi:hypothetical protein EZS27_042223, partial [termite gut metagenome]